MTVTWKKIKKNKAGKKLLKQIKYIQVQYSTDPTFMTNVVSKKVGKGKTSTKLKLQRKSVYYIRMRYVAKDGGFSNWSNKKRVQNRLIMGHPFNWMPDFVFYSDYFGKLLCCIRLLCLID